MMIHVRWRGLAAITALLAMTLSCSTPGGGTRDGSTCVPGQSVACTCDGGAHGARTCSPDASFGACVCGSTMDGGMCTGASDCDDHLFCNGVEQCAPGAMGANARGCVASAAAACAAGMMCDETMHTCHAGDAMIEASGDPCDVDGDHHPAATVACGGDDCDDHDPARHPRALEFCTGMLPDGRIAADHDEDCDPCTVFNAAIDGDGDQDRDGYPWSHCTNPWLTSSRPGGCNAALVNIVDPTAPDTIGTVAGDDCNDDPGPVSVDAGADGGDASADGGDGAIDGAVTRDAATDAITDVQDAGRTLTGRDIHPGQVEVCNGLDDNCNGQIDESLPQETWYPDCDGDGHGDASSSGMMACSVVYAASCNGHQPVMDHTDCDDTSASRYQSLVGYPDADGDFHCVGGMMMVCTGATLPTGFSDHCVAMTDCNDSNGTIWTSLMGYPDSDGDGHCSSGAAMTFCTSGTLPTGYHASCPGGTSDCNDGNGTIWVNVSCAPDADGDGHCSSCTPATVCSNGTCPSGQRAPITCVSCTDCNDGNAGVFTTMNCYPDSDGDGFCTSCTATSTCTNGTCPLPSRSGCPNGCSDCDDSRGDRFQMISCSPDIDSDGYCLAAQSYCAGTDCSSGATLFGIHLLDPALCRGSDCDDLNASAPADAITCWGCSSGWTYDSACGRARFHSTPTYGHCCGGFCGQPNPWSNTLSGIGCPPGYAFIGCSVNQSSGSGTFTESDNIAGASCTINQYCNGIDGNGCNLIPVCQPSP